ncbi:MAG: DNA replication/repair protein RecF [Bacteroidales bacterium]|nr:DNA replication/repair protein RecF [Bacteroidales bacterium]
MPYIKNISIVDFKNIACAKLEFSGKVNCICGDNAQGKTNLLEAIHYLSMARTSLNLSDRFIYRHGCDTLAINADVCMENGLDSRYQIVSQKGQKSLKKDEKPIQKLSEHLGQIPVVMISPADEDLVGGATECRRRFLNSVICQVNKEYLHALQQYEKLLIHRNTCLKSDNIDNMVLNILNEQMAAEAEKIYYVRRDFLKELAPLVAKYYSWISPYGEVADLQYATSMREGAISTMFEDSLSIDMAYKFTSVGPQRDDIEFLLDGFSLKKNGSQGQKKSFLVALKFAQYELMCSRYGFSPILLLDDLFDKLDYNRIENMLSMVLKYDFGQVFITDCHRSALSELVGRLTSDGRFFEASAGEFKIIDKNGLI